MANRTARQAGAFAVAGLEHEQLALLNRELEILHVLEMGFERLADLFQFGKRLGHVILQLRHRFGRAHSGHHVFALRVDEKFAVENLSRRSPGRA